MATANFMRLPPEQFRRQCRLPDFATPKLYSLYLHPDLAAATFSGAVDVALDVLRPTRFLVLNCLDLELHSPSLLFKPSDRPDEGIRPVEVYLWEEDEILVLEFDDCLPVGSGVLSVRFDGVLNDKMRGFYRSKYETDGEERNMAVTQFEPADARRCFPCWDEPAFKARFKLTLEVPLDLVALSNMPVVSEVVVGNHRKVIFEESPIMSTYLVAVVIGYLDHVEAFNPDGIQVRVYSRVGKSNLGHFALDVAVETLDLYQKYFAIPYPLSKLDMVAIPDFALGAMENYGLITYRETALLYDEQHSSAGNKQRVAIVVAHELAHQWFGNLVTMEWWTHLWLNEGFATWVSFLATDKLFPDWKVWNQFLAQTTEGLKLDGLAESHPIEVEVNHSREIDEIFDAISYRKGASVIRMLHNYLGAECFQRSLISYIKRYACSNAKTEDLWTVLEEESSQPVKMIMNSWTKQKGYPVMCVELKDNWLKIEQSHFLLSGHEGDGQWIVPITLCCGSYNFQKSFLMHGKYENLNVTEIVEPSIATAGFQIEGSSPERLWIKFNVDQTGFYRVKYDDILAKRLRYAIESGFLPASDRYGTLDDAFSLCMASKNTLTSLLLLMGAYREEADYSVLSYLVDISYKILKLVSDAAPELSNDVKQFLINLLQNSSGKLGWDGNNAESHLDAMLRGEILTALVIFGEEHTQTEAKRRFFSFLDGNTSLLLPDTRKAAYVSIMRTTNSSNRFGFESLLQIYRETDLSQEKVRILGSLAMCPDPDIVLEVLNFLLSTEVRSQDVFHGLSGIRMEGREVAWAWLKDNWDYISRTWAGLLLGRFISIIVSKFCSEEKVKEVTEFFSTRLNPSLARTLKQSIERVQNNCRWAASVRKEAHLKEAVQELAYRKC